MYLLFTALIYSDILENFMGIGQFSWTISFKKLRAKKFSLKIEMAVKRNKCNHCGKSYSTTETMKLHIKTVHKGLKLFSCTSCDKKYTQSHNLASHIKIVHEGQKTEKLYKCALCDKSFTQSHSLKSHNEHVHKGNKSKVSKSENVKNNAESARGKLTKKISRSKNFKNTNYGVHKGNKIEPKKENSNQNSFVHDEIKIESVKNNLKLARDNYTKISPIKDETYDINLKIEPEQDSSNQKSFVHEEENKIESGKKSVHQGNKFEEIPEEQSNEKFSDYTPDENSLKCNKSNQEFENIAALRLHESNVNPPMSADYQCNLCEKTFNRKTDKIQHISDVHGYFKDYIDTFQFASEPCPYFFTRFTDETTWQLKFP